jgi:hypothetical protein
MLADYTPRQISDDIEGLAASLAVYRDSIPLIMDHLDSYVSEEIYDQLGHAGYLFTEVITILDTVAEDILEVDFA